MNRWNIYKNIFQLCSARQVQDIFCIFSWILIKQLHNCSASSPWQQKPIFLRIPPTLSLFVIFNFQLFKLNNAAPSTPSRHTIHHSSVLDWKIECQQRTSESPRQEPGGPRDLCVSNTEPCSLSVHFHLFIYCPWQHAECRTGDTEQCLHCMHQLYLVPRLPRYKGFTPRLFTHWTSINLLDWERVSTFRLILLSCIWPKHTYASPEVQIKLCIVNE